MPRPRRKPVTRKQKALARFIWLGTPEGQAADRHWRKHQRQIIERALQSDRDQKLHRQRLLAAEAAPQEVTI